MTEQISTWIVFTSVIIALLIIDLGILNKKDEVISFLDFGQNYSLERLILFKKITFQNSII